MIAATLYIAASILLVIGSLFTLTAAIGVIRLPDVYSRMHAASKAGTLGSCLILISLAIVEADVSVATRVFAGVVFFLITAPISAHLLAKAALQAGYPMWAGYDCDESSQLRPSDAPKSDDLSNVGATDRTV